MNKNDGRCYKANHNTPRLRQSCDAELMVDVIKLITILQDKESKAPIARTVDVIKLITILQDELECMNAIKKVDVIKLITILQDSTTSEFRGE